jgi:hypothetical protein
LRQIFGSLGHGRGQSSVLQGFSSRKKSGVNREV